MPSLIFVILMLLSACSRLTIEEVIEKDIPFNVKEVIHKEKVKDGVILLYLTEQKNNHGIFDTVTVAFLKGNARDGWKNAGHNHWEHAESDWITVYKDVFYEYNKKGMLENYLPVIYGKVENDNVRFVNVLGEEEKLEKAYIIEKDSGRYFIKIGNYELVRGEMKNRWK
ncbi:hypothetical protein H0173_11265 [Bacillus sp. S/N-304-OC-R1]|nr:hypothetical protein [Bacillus sp. S/N-304-OC-R1]